MIMDSINKVRDEKVRTLAKTLRQSGLAASDSEAIRMAEGMTSTESRIQEVTESKKVPPKKPEPQQVQEQKRQEPAREESEDIPGSIERHDQNLLSENDVLDFSKITTEQAAGYQQEDQFKKEESEYDEELQRTEEPEELDDEASELDDLDEPEELDDEASELDDFEEKEETKEKEESENRDEPKPAFITPERKPKKDMSQFEESQVDLGAVFNSSKK